MSSILDAWTHAAGQASTETIYPDGCRDLIIIRQTGYAPVCFVCDFQTRPYKVDIDADLALTGYRLKPGVRVQEEDLVRHVLARDCDEQHAAHLVDEHSSQDPRIAEAIACLAQESASVARAARSLGVSPRSLQRLFREQALMPPVFWTMLSRARRTAARMTGAEGLADLAIASGYADQAHMTRSFQRWFGVPPAHVMRDAGLRQVLSQSGVGTPATGEQISTR